MPRENRHHRATALRTQHGAGKGTAIVIALVCAALDVSCTPLDPRTDSAAGLLNVNSGGQSGASSMTSDTVAGRSGTSAMGGAPTSSSLAGNWGCLDEPIVMTDQPPQRIQYIVGIVDFDSQPPPNLPTPVTGLHVDVCGSPSCDPPYSAPDVVINNPLPNQPPYVYMIEFPYNFSNGYLRLTAPDYARMDYVFGGPMKGPPEGGYIVRGLTIPLLKVATRDTIYNDLGLPGHADPTRGVLAARTLDCGRIASGQAPAQGQRAQGVRLQANPGPPDPPAVAWTLSFSNRATPNKLETDTRGVAGFVNVLPGIVDVEGIAPVGPNGTAYGTTTVPVRAGVITLFEIRHGLDQWGQ